MRHDRVAVVGKVLETKQSGYLVNLTLPQCQGEWVVTLATRVVALAREYSTESVL